ncbi:hypothetical protein ACFSX5_15485 [Devosia albogilva]|uniref:Uncharacterized protein n=1 Tax=Devosia albogilva TaxID=429726 RepID=A0ABW5QNV3_9HYPH
MTTAPTSSEEARIAHLGMVQGVISRVASDAQNSRTLAITLAAAMIAIAQTGSNATPWLAGLGIAPTLLFWWQNAFALHVERSYRNLYDEVRHGRIIEPFTMDWRSCLHSAPPWRTALEFVVALPFATVVVILAVIAKVTA